MSLRTPITDPSDPIERQRLNYKIIDAGTSSGLGDVGAWANYKLHRLLIGKRLENSGMAGYGHKPFADESKRAEEARFLAKFGMSAEEILEMSGIGRAIFEDFGSDVEKLFDTKNLRLDKEFADKAFGDFQEARKKGGEVEQEKLLRYQEGLKKFMKNYGEIYDSSTLLDKDLSERAQKRLLSWDSTPDLSGGPVSIAKGFKLDKTGATAITNLKLKIDAAEKAVDSLERIKGDFGKKGVAGLIRDNAISAKKYSYSKGKEQRTAVKLNNIHRSVQGHLTAYYGSAFEILSAMAIAEAADEIISGVDVAGSDTGGTLKHADGSRWDIRTSKTDVRAYAEKLGVSINLSNKAQSKQTTDYTKAFDGSVYQMLKIFAESESISTIRTAFGATEARSSSSQFSQYLASSLTDFAVGGLDGRDRIDFMVYQDGIISLSEYLGGLSEVRARIGTPSRVRSVYGGSYKEWYKKEMKSAAQGTITINVR